MREFGEFYYVIPTFRKMREWGILLCKPTHGRDASREAVIITIYGRMTLDSPLPPGTPPEKLPR